MKRREDCYEAKSMALDEPMAAYDQFILFGDSLLQHSSSQGRGFALAPELQAGEPVFLYDLGVEAALAFNLHTRFCLVAGSCADCYGEYIRRLDVVNRGFRHDIDFRSYPQDRKLM